MKRKPDPLLRTQPWKIISVFGPIERILHRLESDGTVETDGRHIVFREDGRGGWYDAIAALRGVIQFHQIAEARYGIPSSTEGLVRFANKLDVSAPIFLEDIAMVRANIETCKRQALQLRVSQASDIADTISIGYEMEKRGLTKEAA